MSFAGVLSLYHVDCDLRHVRCADVGTVGALARAHLNARRQGVRLHVLHAPPELQELIAFAGLLRGVHAILYGPPVREPAEEAFGWRSALPVAAPLALLVLTGLAWPPGLADVLARIVAIVVP